MVLAAAMLSLLRPKLAAEFAELRANSDVYALPAPEQAIVLSLGYRAALADLIWGNVLVSYGLHFQDQRKFEFVGNYLDTINALDPKFEPPYRFADTLLTLQPKPPTLEDYEKARAIQERGLLALPYSSELHVTAGQFIAYVAPPHLPAAVRAEWRLAGAKILARACELGSDNSSVPRQCIGAAQLLDRAGERDAMIQMLTRTLAVNDDPKVRELAIAYLRKHVDERDHDGRQQRFKNECQRDLGFVGKETMLVIGPKVEPLTCLRERLEAAKDCITTWREWAEATEPEALPAL